MAGAEHDTLDIAKVTAEIVRLREALDEYRLVVERLVSDEELLRLSRRARQETLFHPLAGDRRGSAPVDEVQELE